MAETLQSNFLQSRPTSEITVQRLDFSKTTLPEYAGLYAVILDNVMDQSECNALLTAAKSTTLASWEQAMINIGGGKQALYTDVRNCGRIIWDSQDVVDRIWQRIQHIPEVREVLRFDNQPFVTGWGPAKRREIMEFTRPNERMRFLKYVGGEYFREHCDGSYVTPDGSERSLVTLHLYLNGSGVHDDVLRGGATTFHSLRGDSVTDVEVLPKVGRILLFQHRGLLHSGSDVLAGEKYTMRTDLMYASRTPLRA